MKRDSTSTTVSAIPEHLRKYVVTQEPDRYTNEEHAVWRFIMRQLIDFLSLHAHPTYIEGLRKTGIEVDRIPTIDRIDTHLQEFGWRAVPVSGFIPPAAFMEFQSLGVLPIASDMRSVEHLQYTPAPDIVHEAAGHAPILIDPKFAAYLRKYADVARKAIVTKEDIAQYQAIRRLSDVKELPGATLTQIREAEEHLSKVNSQIEEISEAGWLSRMNWWTAEYGLFGSLERPLIYGAGLLSSVGESRWCLTKNVKKLPLSVNCINFGYDITEPQPQLFVAEDFDQLHSVLDDLSELMAYRRGGAVGLKRAIVAQTVNTIELDTGVSVSGQVTEGTFSEGEHTEVDFVRFSGPCQISFRGREISGQGVQRHQHGFSTPIGRIKGMNSPISTASESDLASLGLRPGQRGMWHFISGVVVDGHWQDFLRVEGRLVLVTLSDCTVKRGTQILFAPEWGLFDMLIGDHIVSIFSGAADREHFPRNEDFPPIRVPHRTPDQYKSELSHLYGDLQKLRSQRQTHSPEQLRRQWEGLNLRRRQGFAKEWLLGVELAELAFILDFEDRESIKTALSHELNLIPHLDDQSRECIRDGIKLADLRL